MPPTLLGSDRLRQLLDSGGQIILANRVEHPGDTRIVSAALVRHYADGETERFAVFDLDIAPNESLTFDAEHPRDSATVAIEAILRVLVAGRKGVAQAYAVASTLRDTGLGVAEFGIVDRPATLGVGESAVPGADGLAVYARPA
jgi:hypothetical protein